MSLGSFSECDLEVLWNVSRAAAKHDQPRYKRAKQRLEPSFNCFHRIVQRSERVANLYRLFSSEELEYIYSPGFVHPHDQLVAHDLAFRCQGFFVTSFSALSARTPSSL